ncbi:MAG TPA: RNA-binding protein [Candidatus Krumholzibacteria bacterium]
MNRKLYVGNLNFSTTEDELRDLFSQAGPVSSVSMIMDRETGRPRGFAFIEMETPEGAQQAIEKLNNREFAQRTLTVNEARPKTEGGRDGGRGVDRGFSRNSGGFGGNRRRF